jgi:diguanylate cyclase (GGDEF)-like protein
MLRSLLVPGGVLLAALALLPSLGWLTLALPALNFLYYCAIAGGILLAWRFHSSRIFFAVSVLFLADGAIGLWGAGQLPVVQTVVGTAAVLVPLDFLLIAVMQERGFTAESLTPVALLLFVEVVVVAVLCRIAESKLPSPAHPRHSPVAIVLPDYALLIFAATGAVLLIRFLLLRKPVESALFWALWAFFLSMHYTTDPRLATLYSATAACILSTSIIESSYLLAYHDELTSLPSRRAFNDALLRLQEPYSIAMVDIDHFKKFNDTYGHDTGDQVLRLVALNLARVMGGGRAYRCGGEEFTILFPGKGIADVLAHLEQLREAIQSSEFRMRGTDRRQTPRGPDRRNQRASRRASKGQVIRQLALDFPPSLSVTVSIGVASSGKKNSDPHIVLEAADKALYRAKANGRNRVEAASPPRKAGAKAAGIA